ncbi:hypothetical protein AOLI_G00004880 [Acnodon oligacanthus]
MPDINREILLEGLSALTGITVKPYTKLRRRSKAVELTADNFLHAVFKTGSHLDLTYSVAPSLWSLSSGMKQLSVYSDTESSDDEETEISAFRKEYFVDMDEFFDPKFDYNFRRRSKSSTCFRGGEPYTRPWGWYRFALKVLDKYPDGNTWLGPKGWRNESAPGEWPVSFHGTSIHGAKAIAETHYRAGPRETYGRGIYSTPVISKAERYAMSKRFTSKNGKTYKVIMQNRINPEKRVETVKADYWLIPVREGTSPAKEKKIVERSIRPYGILIKEVLYSGNNLHPELHSCNQSPSIPYTCSCGQISSNLHPVLHSSEGHHPATTSSQARLREVAIPIQLVGKPRVTTSSKPCLRSVKKFFWSSALTGITVKPHTELQEDSTAVELTVENVLHVVFKTWLQFVVPGLTSLMSQLSVKSEVSSFWKEYFVNVDNFFDPKFDYDFRSGSRSSECCHDGWRRSLADGEWPVSFHGTSTEGAKGITETHYRAGPRNVCGRGIYSTPDISTADKYAMAKKFTSKNGKTYKAIMQNRINPEKRVITKTKDYWLIPVPQKTSPEKEKEIVETSIRPYGILIKEV